MPLLETISRNPIYLQQFIVLLLQTKNNAVAWNPMEAFNFTVANEDCNLYTYDMRKLSVASCVHQVQLILRIYV